MIWDALYLIHILCSSKGYKAVNDAILLELLPFKILFICTTLFVLTTARATTCSLMFFHNFILTIFLFILTNFSSFEQFFFVHLNIFFFVYLNYYFVRLNYVFVHLNYIFVILIFLFIWTFISLKLFDVHLNCYVQTSEHSYEFIESKL